jgi:hypothetical protein
MRENSSAVTRLSVKANLVWDKACRARVAYASGEVSFVASEKRSGPDAPEGDASATPVVPDLDLDSRGAPSSKRKPVAPPARALRIQADQRAHDGAPYSGSALEDVPGTGARIELDSSPLASPKWAPARASRMHRDDPSAFEPPARRRFSWAKLVLSLMALLLIAGAAAVYYAPFYVKGRVAEAGRRSGLAVTVGDVVFRPRELVLHGTRVAVQGLPGVSLNVGEVEIGLEGIEVRSVFVRGLDISIDGGWAETTPRLESWAASLAAPLRLEARAGHLHWSKPFGEGTELEASDAAISTLSGFSLSSPSVLLGVPRGKMGPWRLAIERKESETHLGIGLDPAVPATSIQWTRGQDGHFSVALDVPLSPLSRLGVPPDFVELASDPYVEAHARLESATPPGVLGKLTVSLSNLHGALPHAGTMPADAQLSAVLRGNVGEPFALSGGLVSVGQTKGKVTGALAVDASTQRIALAFQWPDAARGKLPGSVVLDMHDLWATKPSP